MSITVNSSSQRGAQSIDLTDWQLIPPHEPTPAVQNLSSQLIYHNKNIITGDAFLP